MNREAPRETRGWQVVCNPQLYPINGRLHSEHGRIETHQRKRAER